MCSQRSLLVERWLQPQHFRQIPNFYFFVSADQNINQNADALHNDIGA